MNCTNQYCYWNYNGWCSHEGKQGHINATPSELDCPSSLREDFEEQFWILFEECKLLGIKEEVCRQMNFDQLLKFKKSFKESAKGVSYEK